MFANLWIRMAQSTLLEIICQDWSQRETFRRLAHEDLAFVQGLCPWRAERILACHLGVGGPDPPLDVRVEHRRCQPVLAQTVRHNPYVIVEDAPHVQHMHTVVDRLPRR